MPWACSRPISAYGKFWPGRDKFPDASLNDSWQRAVNAFGGVRSSAQVFDAGRTALSGDFARGDRKDRLFRRTRSWPYWRARNKPARDGQQLRVEMASRMRQVLDDQRLVSLDTLLTLGDGLSQMAKGSPAA